jgi:hypothetical protein
MHATFDGLKKINDTAGVVIPSLDLRLGDAAPVFGRIQTHQSWVLKN